MSKFHATFISMLKEPLKAWLNASVIGRAQQKAIISTHIIPILERVQNHHEIDDTPYGGGAGELMRINIIAPLIEEALCFFSHREREKKRVILMDPAGEPFTQAHAQRLCNYEELIFVSGRYEGIDARVYNFVDEALSLGDFILSGGELAALSIFDASARLIPGVLGNALSLKDESHINGRLESSNYTRPPSYKGFSVPELFQNGNHKYIQEARLKEAVIKTARIRPDLLEDYPLKPYEAVILKEEYNYAYPWEKIWEKIGKKNK
jgi:tRNA (guanine37-N1)-methyltransferase